MDDKFIIFIIFCILLLSFVQISQGQPNQKLYFDTTKIKVVEIIHDYNFGFPERDTIEATYIRRYNNKKWYCKGLFGIDYYSYKHPRLFRWRKK